MLGGFHEQLARVERFLSRVRDHDRDPSEYDDDLWSFFQHCFHLKDWIKNDPQVPIAIRRSLEHAFATFQSLNICADLANRTKHRVLTRHVRVGATPTSRNVTIAVEGPLQVQARLGGMPPENAPDDLAIRATVSHIVVLDDGTEHVAQDIAEQAVQDWNTLLRDCNLA
jgi:hypothetical protein